jgi:hypothetical protein
MNIEATKHIRTWPVGNLAVCLFDDWFDRIEATVRDLV